MSEDGIRWVFDALPPSGARRGGNPAEHAFRHDLPTFVREVVQNANDQAKLNPRVHFRYVSLAGEERAQFLEALRWPELEPHLVAATELPDTDRLRAGLTALRSGEPLQVLYIDDFGTDGLTGGEDEDDTHFRALCKDTLFSNKRQEAGGSYGLGKSVLWIFSSFSTVLFDSTLMETMGRTNPRLIGRTELGSHAIAGDDERAYQGPGWFGKARSHDRGERAESVWGKEAASVGDALGFQPRADHQSGTSICVVGFKDPTADEDLGAAELARATRSAVAEYFWPSMSLPKRALDAATVAEGKLTRVKPHDADVAAFVDAWKTYLRGEARPGPPERPGDVTAIELPLTLPATRSGEPAVKGTVALLVRLAESPSAPRAGQVALFRGPGMVVRYWDRSRLALGMRPFHAVLACGRARLPSGPSESDAAIDAFLRMAEPPSHDRWHSTPRLKAHYRRGYAKALSSIRAAVDDALKQLLIAPHLAGTRGPEKLQRRFPIGKGGPRETPASPFGMSGLMASPREGAWSFSGAIERKAGKGPWTAEVRLSEVDESGRSLEDVPIEEFRAEGGAEVSIAGPVASVAVGADVRSLRFEGASAPSGFLGALQLELVGRMVAEGE